MDKARKESRVRSVAKSITWRVLASLDTLIVAYLITGAPIKAVSIAGIEVVTKVVLYYFHERTWQLVPVGTIYNYIRKFTKY